VSQLGIERPTLVTPPPDPQLLPHVPRPAVDVDSRHKDGVVVVGAVTNTELVGGTVTPLTLVTPDSAELKYGYADGPFEVYACPAVPGPIP